MSSDTCPMGVCGGCYTRGAVLNVVKNLAFQIFPNVFNVLYKNVCKKKTAKKIKISTTLSDSEIRNTGLGF